MSLKFKYDYLLVGAGLFNAVIANESAKTGKKCLVVEKRMHIGGNLYNESIEGINIHTYGPHIFHTNNPTIWKYLAELAPFNHFINSPLAKYKDELFNLPINMNTFHQLWNVVTPEEAKKKLEEQREPKNNPGNFEEQALALCGKDIYNKLLKGYTEKQWGRPAKLLPGFLIERLPVRYTYNNNYFNSTFQGIPIGGYNGIIDKCFRECDILLDCNYNLEKKIGKEAETIIYTGMIDEYYDYCFGMLEYRSLQFEHQVLDTDNYQGNAVVNYTDREIPYTRIVEHKHFEFGKQAKTVITKEYPCKWEKGMEAYYPVNTEWNKNLFLKYDQLSKREHHVFFGGRLGRYEYVNMDQTIENALTLFRKLN
ncbi:MAG TPA: UDP-galactopyranose mutase [Porphyromonadaceae bacterium]|jgi:UDP-galactopyranose mutase|nr:UDP-galactopyranose mutase [Porphyromonadaceae bacterium]HCM21632.1 UDP-galactopyranose mutase [Porphyromonadaceae bacterium]